MWWCRCGGVVGDGGVEVVSWWCGADASEWADPEDEDEDEEQ